MVIELLQDLFQRQVETEIRQPVLSFPLPGLADVGLLAPHPFFWAQAVAVSILFLLPHQTFTFSLSYRIFSYWTQALSIQSAINAATAVFTYNFILKRRGSTSSYLIEYGILFPFLIVFPLKLLIFLGVHNMALLTALSASMNIVLFRSMMGKQPL